MHHHALHTLAARGERSAGGSLAGGDSRVGLKCGDPPPLTSEPLAPHSPGRAGRCLSMYENGEVWGRSSKAERCLSVGRQGKGGGWEGRGVRKSETEARKIFLSFFLSRRRVDAPHCIPRESGRSQYVPRVSSCSVPITSAGTPAALSSAASLSWEGEERGTDWAGEEEETRVGGVFICCEASGRPELSRQRVL